MANVKSVEKIIKILQREYPDAKIALKYRNSLQLLIATILSAQCTDKLVNQVTPALFKKYKTAKDYARADIKKFEKEIKPIGLYRAKSRNIIKTGNILIKDFLGRVPDNMEDLITLAGVARKTANVVLYNAFGKIEGIAVDTHVRRLSQRLGLTKNTDPAKIEKDLMKIVPKKMWGKITYLLIDHGRAVCRGVRPK
ncbi:MAG: endonuclease III, partial [Candidatus Margulisbacteria bacterium]|nr:endonuclease III [Candidatus Margulisiibacteriota bacterium]